MTFAALVRRLPRRARLVIGYLFLHALLDRSVERVLHQRLAVHAADEVGRHLAGTEAGHAHLRGNALDLGIDTLVDVLGGDGQRQACRSEEHTSELQSLMRISYAVFCLKKKIKVKEQTDISTHTIRRYHMK